jgi:hypothetical protein
MKELLDDSRNSDQDKVTQLKPAGALGATLHQDWIGWPGFPETFLTVLVAIDEFNSERGATEVFSGIHKAGYLSPKDGQHYHLDADKLNGPAIPLLLEPGDVAIFGCFTPHCSLLTSANVDIFRERGFDERLYFNILTLVTVIALFSKLAFGWLDGKFRYYEMNREFLKNRAASKSIDLGCCTIGLR